MRTITRGHLIIIAALSAPTPSTARDILERQHEPAAICTDGPVWVDDDTEQVTRTFEEVFAGFDEQGYSRAFYSEGRNPSLLGTWNSTWDGPRCLSRGRPYIREHR